jgi:hypothetical protein
MGVAGGRRQGWHSVSARKERRDAMFFGESPQDQLQSYLRPSERLLWAAKPDHEHFARVRWPMVFFGVPWTAITAAVSGGFIYGMFFARDAGFPTPLKPLILLFFVPFWAIGIFMLGGHKFVFARQWHRIAYGITNENIIILQPVPFGRVKEVRLPLKEIENVAIERFARGLGTVEFTGVLSGWSSSNSSSSAQQPKFESVADVDGVVKIARQAQKKNEAEKSANRE